MVLSAGAAKRSRCEAERDAWKALAEARGELIIFGAGRGANYRRATDRAERALADLQRLEAIA